jgi:hypothetical protein
MKKIFRPLCFTLLLSIAFTFYTCTPEGHERNWQPVDLTAYGAPISILAPTDAVIKTGSLKSALLKDLTIQGGDDYSIQLFYSPAMTNDIAKLKNDNLQNVQSNRYFRKIVREEVAGFIYQSVIDTTETYGFHFTKLQGDLEFNFQTGMGKLFTLEDVQMMYEAVK